MTDGTESLREIFVLLDRLHRPKDRAYRDAWRRRGEVLGVFANIARKFDRLEVSLGEPLNPGTEAMADTVADLCVYAGKYATWLAEEFPIEFDAVGLTETSSSCSARRGPDALTSIFSALLLDPTRSTPPIDLRSASDPVGHSFGELESGLIAQAAGLLPMLAPPDKIRIALDLTAASAWFLYRLAESDPPVLRQLHRDVEQMEAMRDVL